MAIKKKPATQQLVARQTVTLDVDGDPYPVFAGVTRVLSDHPAAKAQPDAFEPEAAPPDESSPSW